MHKIKQLNLWQKLGWVEINEESLGMYDKFNQIRFKTSMLRSSFCDYSDLYIIAKEIIRAANIAAADSATNNVDKQVTFKNFVPF